MQVAGLFIKPGSKQPVLSQQRIELLPGKGIDGDCHALVGSPRQVLILDVPTVEAFNLQPGDLRENILLDGKLHGLRSGQGLQIGQVLIRLTFRCEPCAFLESLQPGLKKRIGKQRGWLGMPTTSGTIEVGDAVEVLSNQFPALPDEAKSRFYEFVATIPAGNVVTTKDLLLALGVTSAYYRVIPVFLKQAPAHLPVHRVVAIDGTLLSKHLPQQAARLAAEGIELVDGQVKSSYYWRSDYFYAL